MRVCYCACVRLSAKWRTKYANDIRPCSITSGTFRPPRWSATRLQLENWSAGEPVAEALNRFLSVCVGNLKTFHRKVNEKNI